MAAGARLWRIRRRAEAVRGPEIERVACWVEAGAPEGRSAERPPAPHFIEGWNWGSPIWLARIPRSFTLSAEGGDVFRNFVAPLDLKETRYIRTIELRPGNKRVVHHANILLDHARPWRRPG